MGSHGSIRLLIEDVIHARKQSRPAMGIRSPDIQIHGKGAAVGVIIIRVGEIEGIGVRGG